MPIRIPQRLPAYNTLIKDDIFVISDKQAELQDIRPLKIILLNLMPKKIETETQILRLLGNTPIQVDVEFMHMSSHISKNTPQHHLSTFYTSFEQVRERKFDGLIITGAPVEKLRFEEVNYWSELCAIMEWSKTNVYSTMHVCWGAQAGLYYHFGVRKQTLARKVFGVYKHRTAVKNARLLRGFDGIYLAPHSRHTESLSSDIQEHEDLRVLSISDDAGIHIVGSRSGRQYFIFGHVEYDAGTLASEYFRDIKNGDDIDVPYNYFPQDNPLYAPIHTWSGHANLMYSNWLNYCIYQNTPFDINEIG